MPSEIRRAFLDASNSALQMIETPLVAERWEQPSMLAGYTVGGLAAHLGRAVSTVDGYLDQEVPGGAATTGAVDYFLKALGEHDPIDSELHRTVRRRSEEMAAPGPAAVIDGTRRAVRSLSGRLEAENDDRVVTVFGGMSMVLDAYLETRIVELVIHGDDLAASCPGIEIDTMPAGAWAIARRVVSEVAARRAGDRQFVLGLSRAERAQPPLAF